MNESLVTNIWKKPIPNPPGHIQQGTSPFTAIVGGADSVPVELHFEGIEQQIKVGVDIVFLIDNSGSMDPDYPHSDPYNYRYEAIFGLIDQFEATERNDLDRIAIFTLSGETAVLEPEPGQGWEKWSEIRGTVEDLISRGASGKTPMADGMKKANALLSNSDGFFKLVILLSDGLPSTDAYTNTPYATIVGEEPVSFEDGLVYEAYRNRILYSTIYLRREITASTPEVNTLLMKIARGTDYITPYTSPSANPKYHFCLSDISIDEITNSYRELFGDIMERAVPQSVILRECIDEKLLIDPEVVITFSGNGFREEQNILGFGAEAEAAGITTLEGALEFFKQTRIFEVHLNELNGEATLMFSVKLNLDVINPDHYPEDQVCVDVDLRPGYESYISYLHPTSGAGSIRVDFPLPQARICFRKGLFARKIYNPTATSNLVKIEFCNLDFHPVEWLEFAEYPSGFLNVNDIQDDFEFKPFRLLFNRIIMPWFFEKTWNWAFERSSYAEYLQSLPRLAQRRVRSDWLNNLGVVHEVLENKETHLNPYLCQFSFVENPPTVASNLNDFWRTTTQRGIYKLTENIPPLSTKILSFRIGDASYLKRDGTEWLSWHVDALFPKSGITHTMSWYRAAGMQNDEMVTPNPIHTQLASSQNVRPDLFTGTCFSAKDVIKLRKLFLGPSPDNPWTMLDSSSIEPIWEPRQSKYGVSVKVYNCGDAVGINSVLRVSSYFMLFTGEHEFESDSNYEFSPLPPMFATDERVIHRINPDETITFSINYERLYQLGTRDRSISASELNQVKHAVMINVVDISPAGGEIMVGNNKAIEIVQIMPE